MAGDWIKMRINLDSDPRVLAMAASLNVPELHVVGCLWKVWSWADSHTLDGNALCVTDVTLDRFTAVTGFAAALRNVGWLEGRDNALSFPRFAEHNGQTAKKRGETALRVAKSRNAKRVTDVTQKVLPEKRREEKSNNPLPPLKIPERYDKPEVREALSRWSNHYAAKRGEVLSQLSLDAILMDAARLSWDATRLVVNINGSIGKGWATINDVVDKPGIAPSEKPEVKPVYHEPMAPRRKREVVQ